MQIEVAPGEYGDGHYSLHFAAMGIIAPVPLFCERSSRFCMSTDMRILGSAVVDLVVLRRVRTTLTNLPIRGS
jgi:hypothetical protein